MWLVCVSRRTSSDSCAFRIQIVSILFTCLYINNTLLADSEIHEFINFEFRNYRLRLESPLDRIELFPIILVPS